MNHSQPTKMCHRWLVHDGPVQESADCWAHDSCSEQGLTTVAAKAMAGMGIVHMLNLSA